MLSFIHVQHLAIKKRRSNYWCYILILKSPPALRGKNKHVLSFCLLIKCLLMYSGRAFVEDIEGEQVAQCHSQGGCLLVFLFSFSFCITHHQTSRVLLLLHLVVWYWFMPSIRLCCFYNLVCTWWQFLTFKEINLLHENL